MSDREVLTQREAAAWDELRAVIDRMTPERREAPTATDEGWSVKDVLWHIAHWWDDLSRMLEELAERGSFTEAPEDDAVTDAVNEQTLVISRSMGLDEVEAGVEGARLRMLRSWAAVPEVTEGAAQWFVWETIEHYEEHLPHVRRAATAPS